MAHPFCARFEYTGINGAKVRSLDTSEEKEVGMSPKWSEIRWGRVVLGVILAVAIFVVVPILINVGYGVVLGFQMRGSPPNEAIMEFALSTPVLTVGVMVTLVGALFGGRIPARQAEDGKQLNGFVVGVGTAVVILVLVLVQGGLDMWSVSHLLAAILGGWLGGLIASRSDQSWTEG